MSAPALPADADGFDLRPDPMLARTEADLMAALREYRTWAGAPSFRQISRDSGRAAAASTICAAVNADTLPRLETFIAIAAGCGADSEYQRRFATAWRAIRLGHPFAGAA